MGQWEGKGKRVMRCGGSATTVNMSRMSRMSRCCCCDGY